MTLYREGRYRIHITEWKLRTSAYIPYTTSEASYGETSLGRGRSNRDETEIDTATWILALPSQQKPLRNQNSPPTEVNSNELPLQAS